MKIPTWIKVNARLVEVIGLLVAIISAKASYDQATIAHANADAANQHQEEAKKSEDSARQQLEAATQQAEAAKQQADSASQMAKLAANQLDIMKAELDASNRSAKALEENVLALKMQIKVFSNGTREQIAAEKLRDTNAQRARLSAGPILVDDFQVGKNPKASITFQNRGSTSAHNVFVWHDWVRYDATHSLPNTPLCKEQNAGAAGTIGAEGGYTFTRPTTWSETERATPDNPLIIIGSVCYDDETGKQHQTTFCRVINGDGTINKCAKGERES